MRLYCFVDYNDKKCSLQQSSLATESAVWFGQGVYRMHLTQEQVGALLPLLEAFARDGELPEEKG